MDCYPPDKRFSTILDPPKARLESVIFRTTHFFSHFVKFMMLYLLISSVTHVFCATVLYQGVSNHI